MIYIEMDGQEWKIRLYGDFEIEKYKDNYMLENYCSLNMHENTDAPK